MTRYTSAEYEQLLARKVREKKPAKYRNVRTVVDGIEFDSKKEAKRYQELKLLEKAKQIFTLATQPRYSLTVNNQLICTYVADFEYSNLLGDVTVEDVKGVRTEAYRIKRKLMKAIYGIDILET